MTSSSSNIGSRVSRHKESDFLVSENINKAYFRGITRLEETIFQDNKIDFVPTVVLEDLISRSNPLYDCQKNVWVD